MGWSVGAVTTKRFIDVRKLDCGEVSILSFNSTALTLNPEPGLYGMEQMFDVVQDVERYHEFLPWCHSSKVFSRTNDLLKANLEVGIPPIVEAYTSNVTLIRPHTIRAVSTQGKLFKELINIWRFNPGLKGTPNSCVVDFYVSFEFRSALASQLSKIFFNEVVVAMTGAFYNEAKRRYGQESVPSRRIEIIPSSSNNDGRKS